MKRKARCRIRLQGRDFRERIFIEPQTLASGSAFDIAFSPDPRQLYLYVADGSNGEVHIVSRSDGKRVAGFGRPGRMAGEFKTVHGIAIDSKSNLYTAEVGNGRRIQKFVRFTERMPAP
jgi:sugar lactone lactonase YvrE